MKQYNGKVIMEQYKGVHVYYMVPIQGVSALPLVQAVTISSGHVFISITVNTVVDFVKRTLCIEFSLPRFIFF